MNTLQKVRETGRKVELTGDDTIKISPPPPKTWVIRLKAVKPELVEALKAERPAERLGPEKKADNAESRAILEKGFYHHIFGEGVKKGCCYAPRNRYCAEGKRLKDIYYGACS